MCSYNSCLDSLPSWEVGTWPHPIATLRALQPPLSLGNNTLHINAVAVDTDERDNRAEILITASNYFTSVVMPSQDATLDLGADDMLGARCEDTSVDMEHEGEGQLDVKDDGSSGNCCSDEEEGGGDDSDSIGDSIRRDSDICSDHDIIHQRRPRRRNYYVDSMSNGRGKMRGRERRRGRWQEGGGGAG